MEKEIEINYDKENDILLLHLAGQRSAGSVEIGDFIVDFSQDMGKAIGMEILNASSVLTGVFGFDISKVMLSTIKRAYLRTVNKGDAIYVYYGFVAISAEKEAPFCSMIPMPQIMV